MVNEEGAKANASLAALLANGGAVRTSVSHILTAPDEFKNINFVSHARGSGGGRGWLAFRSRDFAFQVIETRDRGCSKLLLAK